MSFDTVKPGAGWYNVPGAPGSIRWWSGTQWIGAVHVPAGVSPSLSPGATPTPALTLPQYAPARPAGSPIGWISLGLIGIALLLFGGLLGDGPLRYFVMAITAASLALGVIALVRRRRGVRVRLWAPIAGIALSSLYLVVAVTVVVSMGLAGSGATENVGALANVPRTFPNNPELTEAENAENAIIATIHNQDQVGALAPKHLTLRSDDTVWGDGIYLSTLPPGHWSMSYVRSPDKRSFTLSMSGVDKSEVATYSSATQLYVAKCPPGDHTCVPLPVDKAPANN